MFLKSLTLKGFKSFAETTTLEFEPGIAVVVGPNGSGKSNIVDAVAWVLGAQGPRTVRSSKMDDVIFAGSSRRPALGRAEVSLTIDNSSGLVPLEFPEVTFTRTLFRSGESDYAVNGVPCRLLDIQELLSETGIGRQQHVIVSQGQLSAVLDARAEDRRQVIEEAAGVLKYRRRREKAQRRLEATEANLVRLQDLLREVRRQLRPLERQAEAARLHGSLVEELRAIGLHLAGRDLVALQARLETGAAAKEELAAAEAVSQAALTRLQAEVAAAEAALPTVGEDHTAEDLVRLEGLRQRARGLAAVLGERRRSIERQLQATVDEAVVASLEAEAAELAAHLGALDAEAADLDRRAADLAAPGPEWEGRGPAGGPGAAEARGELSALRRGVERGERELAQLRGRRAALAEQDERLEAELSALRSELARADQADAELAPALEAAELRLATARSAAADAEAGRRRAEQELHTWRARSEALTLALEEARARAGMEHLGLVPGVVGTLLDVVEVDEGWQAAFEAAAGEAISAVVVDGVDAARRALTELRGGDPAWAGVAVVAIDAARPPASLALDAAAVGAEPVRAHVRSRWPGVDRLLDTLLAEAVAVEGGWEEALDLALAHPGVITVTAHGDRFSAAGWRVGAAAAGATGAALEEARARAAAAGDACAETALVVAATEAELGDAGAAVAELARRVDAHDSRLTALTEALGRVDTARRGIAIEDQAVRAHLDEVAERVERERARMEALEAALPALEAQEATRAAVADQTSRLEQRRTMVAQRLAEVEQRLRRLSGGREAAAGRRLRLERSAVAVDGLAAVVHRWLPVLDAQLEARRERRRRDQRAARAQVERLNRLRAERSRAEHEVARGREQAQRLELEEAELRLRIEAVAAAVAAEFGCAPETAVAADCPDLPAGTSATERRDQLQRQLGLMGPVNPLALEEFAALEERHRFIEAQTDDVKAGRRELARVTRAIDREIVAIFSAAFAEVAENFSRLFATLFPGGTGRLSLSDPDNLLETGVEVEARPSGKNVRKLSLLSGGERSLAALAFLFAVFRSRPSPFYLLDEVEAALDDVNLHRFLDLVHEFRDEAQLVVVTHQKRTMEAADCLYGVTMQAGGSSRVLSQRLATSA